MGTWTDLHLGEVHFSSKVGAGIDEGSDAPILWYSLFSSDDVFVEKSSDGDNFACAGTKAHKARERIRMIEMTVAGNPYLEALFAPLEFFQRILSVIGDEDVVGFNLCDFQNFDGSWDPETAMRYVNSILPVVAAYDSLLKRGPLERTLKMFRRSSILFSGSLETDQKVLAENLKNNTSWKEPVWEGAVYYLIGGCESKGVDAELRTWAQPRKWIWEGGRENKDEAASVDKLIKIAIKKPRLRKAITDGPRKVRLDDGRAELNYKNGRLHGLCRFFEGNVLVSEINYRNGLRHGLAKYWEECTGGNIRSISHFKNDRLDGEDKFYEYSEDLRPGVIPETPSYVTIFKNGKISIV